VKLVINIKPLEYTSPR